MAFLITNVHARWILDSRGNPTVECEVQLRGGAAGRAAVPSGASTGKYEAVELRDGGKRWGGRGVTKAVKHINGRIQKALAGLDARDQERIDHTLIALDGTPNKRRLGANATLAVSLATSRAAASALGLHDYEYLGRYTHAEPRLPVPFANVINGGKHAAGKLKPQEFMIAPVGAKSFAEAARIVSETYHALATLLRERYGPAAVHVGDEGGFAPPLESAEEALDLLALAVKRAGHTRTVRFALDPAASELYHDGVYDIGTHLLPDDLVTYWETLTQHYPIISLEDPFDQDDALSWHHLMSRVGGRLQIVGDDLTVTNPARIRKARAEQLCNALLLKVNQIGTLTEALAAAREARDAGWKVMVSHRSGETEDPFIADLAVALGCGQIKLGAPCRTDRTTKYNELLRIEERLGAPYGL